MDSTELEDIYLPYKPKRRTRAQIAREQGLEPLALAIMREAQKPTAPSASSEPTVTDRREVKGGGAPPNLPERGGVPMRTRENKGTLNLPQHLSKELANLSLPLSGESEGALDIIAEIVSENQQARNTVRTAYQHGAVITSKVIKKMKDTDEAQKFADYRNVSSPSTPVLPTDVRLLALTNKVTSFIMRLSIHIHHVIR